MLFYWLLELPAGSGEFVSVITDGAPETIDCSPEFAGAAVDTRQQQSNAGTRYALTTTAPAPAPADPAPAPAAAG